MAHSKQAEKRIRQNERARARNKQARSAMKSAVKKVLNAESPDAARTSLAEAMSRVDKAAKKNVIHRNAAARKKSQLARAAARARTAG
jgi:small subunit ribosomal protein S20